MLLDTLPRLKAPRDDGAVLSHPPLAHIGALLTENVRRLNADAPCRTDIPVRPAKPGCPSAGRTGMSVQQLGGLGMSLDELRQLARMEVLSAARRYLEEAGEPVPDWSGERLLLAGHQPELFHPGVWFKNFALQALAQKHTAIPLNLVVDNDVVKDTSLRVPHGPRVARVPFDQGMSDAPYEERRVLDEALFANLPERVAELTRDWPFQPLLPQFWRAVRRHAERTPLLGERFARARRDLERAWGARPLEVPLCRVCQTEAFARFAIHLLRDLPRFHAAYNGAVKDYRARHGLRSRNHPVPDLATSGDWLEAPFWTWTAGVGRRHRLFATGNGDTIQLRAAGEIVAELRDDAESQVAQWRRLEGEGRKLRTRALTTTLFSRLCLGDLFVHGIGGGKYDEVTDRIIRDFFGLAPPGYVVLTATMLLPLERYPDAAAQRHELQRLLRDLHWNPHRHVSKDGDLRVRHILAERQAWIERPCSTHAERKRRYEKLRTLTEQLRPQVRLEENHVARHLRGLDDLERLHEARSSREYAFCLFPEEMLQSFYRDGLV
jgi:hypothetical protein